MTPDLESGVERRLESPDEGEEVRLIVGVESASNGVAEQLANAGATVHDELPLDHFAVSTTEEKIADLCELDVVTSIEIDSEGRVFSSDFRSPAG